MIVVISRHGFTSLISRMSKVVGIYGWTIQLSQMSLFRDHNSEGGQWVGRREAYAIVFTSLSLPRSPFQQIRYSLSINPWNGEGKNMDSYFVFFQRWRSFFFLISNTHCWRNGEKMVEIDNKSVHSKIKD